MDFHTIADSGSKCLPFPVCNKKILILIIVNSDYLVLIPFFCQEGGSKEFN